MLDTSHNLGILDAGLERPAREQRQWDALFLTLFSDLNTIARHVRMSIRLELPSYHLMPTARLDAEVLDQVSSVLRRAHQGSAAASATAQAEPATVGALRCRQGIPVDDMLRAWTIGVQVAIRHARRRAATLDLDTEHLLDFVQSALEWSDAAMATAAAAHRDATPDLTCQDRSSFVRKALTSALPPAEILSRASTYGLDARQRYFAVRARPAEGLARREVDGLLPFRSADHGRDSAGTHIDGDVAGFVRERPAGQTAATIGVGPARTLDQIDESFRLATRALDTAHKFGLGGAHDLDSLGLRVAVAADRDVGEAMHQRYVAPISLSNSGPELLASLREYLACGMHVERTAERLFVHQNTVRYRVARCEEAIQASLRDPRVAMEVSWGLDWAIVQSRQAAEPRTSPLEQSPSSWP
ncbi:PucR family transcriptional regulator [Tomitella biformata]|uniref:PucR family transcriptional regulator n=1 Tax=Tomitella biformata TaxID=630403 RepID=UPI000463DA83|nr:helix-turn-helix domain-containing protein [Tomitella biformata]